MFCDEEHFTDISTGDFEFLHQEVADICFDGSSDFCFSDIAASFGGFAAGGWDGGGDGGGE